MDTPTNTADHLVVLIHGLWGNPSHLAYLVKSLREQFQEDQLHILVPKSNTSNFTYDGIETGGERITHEIETELTRLEEAGSKVRKISVIGYSLGGLLARYAIGLLQSSGVFDRIQPVNFTTFATPHLGARTPLKGTASNLWNEIGSRTLSASGRQLFLVDEFRNTGRPLLAVMADPKSIFVQGLTRFQHRSLYANILNDRSVVYYTAAIESTDPYVDLNNVSLNTLPGSEGILLDPKDPVRRKQPEDSTALQRVSDTAIYAASSIPFFMLMTIFLPFGFAYYLGNAALQSFRSAQRVKLHDSGGAGITVSRYRKTPFLVDELRNVADKVYKHAAAAGGEDYLPTPPPEEAEHKRKQSETSSRRGAGEESAATKAYESDTESNTSDDRHFPTLALTEDQFDMIAALNDVGFKKYNVHITSVRHTHAAIIVRIPWRPGMGQGKVVIKHWIDAFVI